MKTMNKIVSVLAVLALLTLAAVPAVGATETAADVPEYTDDENPYELTPMFWLGLYLGIIGAYGLGILTGYELNDALTPPVDNSAVYADYRQHEAEKVITAANTAKNMAASVLPADTQLWAFTSSYWQRAAEYAVCDSWSVDNDFDANTMLVSTGLPHNASNYLYSWSEALDEAYNNLLQQSVKWTGDCYSPLQQSLVWDGGSLTGGTAVTAANCLGLDVCQLATYASGADLVYIDTDYTNTDVTYTYYKELYAFGSSSTYKITNVDTGVSYTLNRGANALTSVYNDTTTATGTLPSGLYRLSSGLTLAGPLCAVGSGSADVGGCFVLSQGSTLDYVTANADGTASVRSNTGAVLQSTANLTVQVTGGTSTVSSVLVGADINLIASYDALVRETGTIVSETATAAATEWSIFDACEASSKYVSPSSLTGGIADHEVTAAEATALAIQQMRQIAQFYKDNQTKLDGYEIVTDLGSLGLVCYGTIYYHGTAMATDVAFTPYITGTANTLQVGTNTWSGSGFAMVWSPADSYAGQSSVQYALVDIDDGYTLDITKIVKAGSQVSSVELAPYVIDKSNSGSDDVTDPDPPPVDTSVDWRVLVVVCLAELAAILCLLGRMTGIPLFYIAAVIVLAAAALWYYWPAITAWWSGLWSGIHLWSRP